MKRSLLLSLFLLSALILQGCASNDSAYNRSAWNAGHSAPHAKAEAGPNAISALNENNILEDGTLPPEEALGAAIQQQPDLPAVKVALLVPLSGKNDKLGEAMLNAAQLGLFDIGHNSFELLPFDTQGSHEGGANAARQAIQSGAQLILGPIFADAVRGAKTIAQPARINIVAFSTDWTLADQSTFMMGFLPFDQVSRIVNFAATQGITDVGALIPKNSYGNVVLSAYQNASYRAGINTVETKQFSPNTRSLSNTMRRFAQYDARKDTPEIMPFQAIFMPVGGENAISIGTLASQYDLRPENVKRLGTGLLDDDRLATEPALDGAWFAAPDPKNRQTFERQYFETFGVSPPRLASLSYDAIALAAVLARNGLQTHGQPDYTQADIANPNGFAGLDGIFRFNHNGIVERGLAILEYRQGNIIVIDAAPRTFQNSRY